MMAIAHFALGVAGAFGILLWAPQLIPNILKNDIFFVLISGFWSLIPDINNVLNIFTYKFWHETWANVFWAHPWVDSFTKDDPKTAAIFIALAIVMGIIYYYHIK